MSSPDKDTAANTTTAGNEDSCGCRKRHKRKRILDCAVAAFAEEDYHQVKTDDIAAAAGVGKGTLFRYFSSKEELFVSAITYCSEIAAAELDHSLAGISHPMEQLEAACEKLVEFYRRNHEFFHLLRHRQSLHQMAGHKEFHEKQNQLRQRITDIIADGQKHGCFRSIDPEIAARMLFSMLRAALRAPQLKESTPRKTVDAILGLFVNGVGKDMK